MALILWSIGFGRIFNQAVKWTKSLLSTRCHIPGWKTNKVVRNSILFDCIRHDFPAWVNAKRTGQERRTNCSRIEWRPGGDFARHDEREARRLGRDHLADDAADRRRRQVRQRPAVDGRQQVSVDEAAVLQGDATPVETVDERALVVVGQHVQTQTVGVAQLKLYGDHLRRTSLLLPTRKANQRRKKWSPRSVFEESAAASRSLLGGAPRWRRPRRSWRPFRRRRGPPHLRCPERHCPSASPS